MNVRSSIYCALASIVAFTLAACSSAPTATTTQLTDVPSATAPTAPTSENSTTTSAVVNGKTTPSAAKGDPWEQYAAVVRPLDPTVTREKFETAKKTFCPQGKEALLNMKRIHAAGQTGSVPQQQAANKKTAVALGALWEFGCGKGHDKQLYTPEPVS